MKFLIFLSFLVTLTSATYHMIITNFCNQTIWPALQETVGKPVPANGGFELKPLESKRINVSLNWGGRIWGRTNCDENGVCETGDCGNGIECNGNPPTLPVNYAEVFLYRHGFDNYAVSLMQGYNLPISVGPAYGSKNDCQTAGCLSDLNEICPPELAVTNADGKIISCTGICYGISDDCENSEYIETFKQACPVSYVTPGEDDEGILLSCTVDWEADLEVYFCPGIQKTF